MPNKTVTIPKFLHDIHGRQTSILCLILTYLFGFLFAALFLFCSSPHLAAWQILIACIIYFDIGGGVISNLSTSTNQYYQSNETKRYTFLLLHVIQPALMISIFPDEYIYFIALVGFTIPGSIIVLLLKMRSPNR